MGCGAGDIGCYVREGDFALVNAGGFLVYWVQVWDSRVYEYESPFYEAGKTEFW